MIESAFSIVETVCRKVKRWYGGAQYLRWIASALLWAESRWNRVQGYRELPILVKGLKNSNSLSSEAFRCATPVPADFVLESPVSTRNRTSSKRSQQSNKNFSLFFHMVTCLFFACRTATFASLVCGRNFVDRGTSCPFASKDDWDVVGIADPKL